MQVTFEYDDDRRIRATAFAQPTNPFSLAMGLYGEGEARCKPEDHYDVTIGEDIAAGRAMADLGAKLERRAEATVITEDQADQLLRAAIRDSFGG